MSYKSVVPRTQLASYSPGTEINFDLLHDGESLEPGSIWLTGDLNCVSTSNDGSLEHYVDNYAGIGSFMENMITRCDVFQEVITNYGRLCKHNAMVQYSPDQMCAGLSHTGEFRAPVLDMMPTLVDSATGNDVNAPNAARKFSFTHKPVIALNSMSAPLSSDKSGRIQVSFKLPSTQKIFFGAPQAPGTVGIVSNYAFSNIQLHYKTRYGLVSGPVVVQIVQDTQKLIQSSKTTIMNTFPDTVSKVLVSFADVQTEIDPTLNSLVCQFPPLQRVSWVYNDVSNGLIAYDIESPEELVLSGLNVMKSIGCGIDLRDKMALTTQDPQHSKTDKFALGLALGKETDFSRSGLGVTVEMQPGNITQYYAYFYAYGMKQIV
jgi:hypothetical protein